MAFLLRYRTFTYATDCKLWKSIPQDRLSLMLRRLFLYRYRYRNPINYHEIRHSYHNLTSTNTPNPRIRFFYRLQGRFNVPCGSFFKKVLDFPLVTGGLCPLSVIDTAKYPTILARPTQSSCHSPPIPLLTHSEPMQEIHIVVPRTSQQGTPIA